MASEKSLHPRMFFMRRRPQQGASLAREGEPAFLPDRPSIIAVYTRTARFKVRGLYRLNAALTGKSCAARVDYAGKHL